MTVNANTLTPGMDYAAVIGSITRVANVAAVSALDDTVLPAGTSVSVDSLGTIGSIGSAYVLSKTSVAAIDGAGVLATYTGVGRWIRQTSVMAQSAWFISALLGNDANDGATAATALKTHNELERRTKGMTIVPPTVSIPVPFPPFALILRPWTVTVLDSLPTSDPVGLQCTFGPDTIPQYLPGAATITSSGTFTAVLSAATPALKRSTNQRYEMTDAARAGLPWENKQRIRITSGPRAGAIGFIGEDLGGNVCVVSDWSIPASYPFPGVTEVTPVPGDPYVVETLVEMSLKGDWEVYRSGNHAVSPGVVNFVSVPYIGITSFKITNTPNAVTLFSNLAPLHFNKCQINPYFYAFTCSFVMNNTALLNGANFSTGGLHFMRSGAVFDSAIPAGTAGSGGNTLGLSRELYCSEGAILYLDADVMCYGGPEWHIGASASVCVAGFFAAFKSVIKAGHPTGFGMKVTPGCLVDFENRGSGGARFWGNANQMKGMYVEPLACVSWGGTPATDLVPTVTGLTGVNKDFAIGTQTNENSTTIDAVAGTDVVGNVPVYLGKIANTWANLDTAAAVASVSFGGNAIDAVGGGRICKFPFIG